MELIYERKLIRFGYRAGIALPQWMITQLGLHQGQPYRLKVNRQRNGDVVMKVRISGNGKGNGNGKGRS